MSETPLEAGELSRAAKPFVEMVARNGFRNLPDGMPVMMGSPMAGHQITAGELRALVAALTKGPLSQTGQ